MKRINYMIIFLLIILIYSCKSTKINNYYDLPLNIIASTHIKKIVEGTRLKESKDMLKLYIQVDADSGYFRNSKYLLQIDVWDKKLFGSTLNDSIFLYAGIEAYFGSTETRFKKLFDTEFKYTTSEIPKNTYKGLSDPISEISFYFNKENEITFIEPTGFDTIYYNLLKGKVKFSKAFMSGFLSDKN